MAKQEIITTRGKYQVIKKADDDPTNDIQYGVIHKDDQWIIAHCTNSIKARHVARALDELEKLDMLGAKSYRVQGIKAMGM